MFINIKFLYYVYFRLKTLLITGDTDVYSRGDALINNSLTGHSTVFSTIL